MCEAEPFQGSDQPYQYFNTGAWLKALNEKYPAEVAERMTRFGGCSPAFSFLEIEVIEVILQRLEEKSRP